MSITLKSADYIAYLTNCLIFGEEIVDTEDGGWSRALIRLAVDDFAVEIRPAPEMVAHHRWSELREKNIITTRIFIGDVTVADEPRARDVAVRLSELLTLATCSEVAIERYEYELGDPCARGFHTLGRLNYFQPIINTRDGTAVREFLERTWHGYARERDRRNLQAVFHMFAHAARTAVPTELMLAARFILLEQLKHSYAVMHRYPFIGGAFYEPGTGGAVKKQGSTKCGLRCLLSRMLRDVGMTNDLDAVIELRNEILHSGLSVKGIAELDTMLQDIDALIREYLLRLIGFTGRYYTGRAGGATSVIEPPLQG